MKLYLPHRVWAVRLQYDNLRNGAQGNTTSSLSDLVHEEDVASLTMAKFEGDILFVKNSTLSCNNKSKLELDTQFPCVFGP